MIFFITFGIALTIGSFALIAATRVRHSPPYHSVSLEDINTIEHPFDASDFPHGVSPVEEKHSHEIAEIMSLAE